MGIDFYGWENQIEKLLWGDKVKNENCELSLWNNYRSNQKMYHSIRFGIINVWHECQSQHRNQNHISAKPDTCTYQIPVCNKMK